MARRPRPTAPAAPIVSWRGRGFTARELDAIATLQQQFGLATVADAIALGLWHLARHADLPIAPDLFRIGEGSE